jgi:tripeptide aminopeptidase
MMKQESVVDRFLRYISIDTCSDDHSESQPSTQKQWNLLRLLEQELKALNVPEVSLDEFGYLMAYIPSNGPQTPGLGFIAHVDTSPDMSGENIKPQIIENYDGKDIVLNKEKQIILSPEDFPELLWYKGQTLITTDGTTLLGADDKAGIAEIMTAVAYIMEHPEIKHGPVRIGFTPDEEIGKGVCHFDVKKFDCPYAYTIDGGALGELEFENFNAASTKLSIQGQNVHPGYAKNKMINALQVGMEFNQLLPSVQRPEHTEGYEGYYHMIRTEGTVENAVFEYIIRDHNRDRFEKKKLFFQECVDFMNKKYGKEIIRLEIKDQYYNMREQIIPHYHLIEKAMEAMTMAGITPIIRPIRGGTDGAQLSFMNLPCPNLFAGGHNFHGKFEFIPIESMHKATEVILNIIRLYTSQTLKK